MMQCGPSRDTALSMEDCVVAQNTIAVPFPHMVLNAHDVPPPDYDMFNSWKVAQSESVDHMLDWIATVAKGAPNGKLATLIFNSHGQPGKILIGQGIDLNSLKSFSKLKGLVLQIWIIACTVSKGSGFGRIFCGDMAKASGAYVTAAVRNQSTGQTAKFPYGMVDEWEGEVYMFNPDGEPRCVQGG